MTRDFVLTRRAALEHLAAVAPRLGRTYAATRNIDAGPQAPPTTTALSPYVRRRLLLEHEVVEAALAAHTATAAEKFVQEVFWRTYFKGFLETHPAVWTGYLDALGVERERLTRNAGLQRSYDAAVEGRTGIDCFDAWAQGLVQTGWLHNHTRMWFASIWVFTLQLPWVLGADFFLRHLIDGDPASNTLSWRWVAGLHTRGKAYAARAENIRRYTDGRFSPNGLNENPAPIEEAEPPASAPLQAADTAPAGDVGLLLHLDDLMPESLALGAARVVHVAGLLAHAPDASERVRQIDETAMQDTLTRAGEWFGCNASLATAGWHDRLPVITAWAPVGPSAGALPPECLRIRRAWDTLIWPRSTRGYFQIKTAIPSILRTLSIG